MSNPTNEISRFLTSVFDLVKEECHTEMLHDNMTLSRLIVYVQSIQESKLETKGRDVKSGTTGEQG